MCFLPTCVFDDSDTHQDGAEAVLPPRYKNELMNTISIAASDRLANATPIQKIDVCNLIAHKGIAADGTAFILINGMNGKNGETIITKL